LLVKIHLCFLLLFDAPHVIRYIFSDHHKHSHSHEGEAKEEEEPKIPAYKKQAVEKAKTDAVDPMAMNWNVDKMEE
jgi:hypothetical protein